MVVAAARVAGRLSVSIALTLVCMFLLRAAPEKLARRDRRIARRQGPGAQFVTTGPPTPGRASPASRQESGICPFQRSSNLVPVTATALAILAKPPRHSPDTPATLPRPWPRRGALQGLATATTTMVVLSWRFPRLASTARNRADAVPAGPATHAPRRLPGFLPSRASPMPSLATTMISLGSSRSGRSGRSTISVDTRQGRAEEVAARIVPGILRTDLALRPATCPAQEPGMVFVEDSIPCPNRTEISGLSPTLIHSMLQQTKDHGGRRAPPCRSASMLRR